MRRQQREQESLKMQTVTQDDVWNTLAPVIDDALTQLQEADRSAVLLHYFENKRLREVGLAFGVNEDAAQKRVSRAIEKLRRILFQRGVVFPAVVLPGLFMTHGALGAPSCLTAKVAAGALNKTVFSTSLFALLNDSYRKGLWAHGKTIVTSASLLALIVGAILFLQPKAALPIIVPPKVEAKMRKQVSPPPPRITTAVRQPSLSPQPAPAASLPSVPARTVVPVMTYPTLAPNLPTPALAKQSAPNVSEQKKDIPDREPGKYRPYNTSTPNWQMPNQPGYPGSGAVSAAGRCRTNPRQKQKAPASF